MKAVISKIFSKRPQRREKHEKPDILVLPWGHYTAQTNSSGFSHPQLERRSAISDSPSDECLVG
jgi:hypothetical protein